MKQDDASVQWIRTKKSDPQGVALANRHYSRKAFGTEGAFLGPPGRLICLISNDRSAVWVSHWPYAHLAMDKKDAFRCTMFRNEGTALSSRLIREAREMTSDVWGTPPVDGWMTWIGVSLIRSGNPGCCFKKDGWIVDPDC